MRGGQSDGVKGGRQRQGNKGSVCYSLEKKKGIVSRPAKPSSVRPPFVLRSFSLSRSLSSLTMAGEVGEWSYDPNVGVGGGGRGKR